MKIPVTRIFLIAGFALFFDYLPAGALNIREHEDHFISAKYLVNERIDAKTLYEYKNTEKESQPVADAGDDITTTMPLNKVFLDGSRTAEKNQGGYIFYNWEKVSGPDQFAIKYPDRAVTELRNLVVGVYTFRLTIHVNNDGEKVSDLVKVTVNADPASPGDVSFTANTRVDPYTAIFQYGTNTGSYGNGWDDTTLVSAAARAGVHSIRLPLPEYFVERYGYDARLDAFKYYSQQLGMKEITLFVGQPSSEHRDHTIYPTATREASTFAHLYEPIWDQGENGTPINENNYFANYIYNLVKRYGKEVHTWEIVNEPDITGFWDNENLERPDNWLENPPSPGSLINLNAPIFNYIRMLRIAYEVVKKYEPQDYIAPGGIGNPAFLDALLRYTDNPDQGKVTSAYPLTGGAYFDIVSFHIYPAYFFKEWSNAIGGFQYFRHSDRAADVVIKFKDRLDSILNKYGYNGTKYPQKPFITSEVNMARKTFGTYWGTNDAQRNFIIKMLVATQQNNIRQFYLYRIGENADYWAATSAYQLMGIYENLTRNAPGQEKFTDEGKAYKTTSQLLYGWHYDATRSKALNLPANIRGAAFKKDNTFRYVLWAETSIDKSEAAKAAYSFPASFNIDTIYRYEWDYSTNPNAYSKSATQGIQLSGTPSFFSEAEIAGGAEPTPTNQSPTASAGSYQTITLPDNSATLNAVGSYDSDGSISSYRWTQVNGPAKAVFSSTTTIKPTISNLVAGLYVFDLTVTDNDGSTSTARTQVTVRSATSNKPPRANAGGYQTINLPDNTVALTGAGSYDPDGSITSYQWIQVDGPAKAAFNSTTKATPTISNLVVGTYVFDLTVTDNNGGTATGTTKVIVKGTTSNKPPRANAGGYQTITLPNNSVTLTGAGSYDPDGSIASYQWTQVDGPAKAAFSSMTDATPTITKLIAGVYVFDLTVTDNKGSTAKGRTQVTVNGGSNQPPRANAGGYQTITLPDNSVTLTGAGSYDPDGSIAFYQWTQVDGPAKAAFSSMTDATPTITKLIAGVYVFDLTVTDNKGSTTTGTTKVIVKGATGNQPPRANAGGYQTITLPDNSVTLTGAGSYDPDGSIASYQWAQVDGPAKAVFSSMTDATPSVRNLVAGVYIFDLTVTDNSGSATIGRTQVTVFQPALSEFNATQVSARLAKMRGYSKEGENQPVGNKEVSAISIPGLLKGGTEQPDIHVYPNPVHTQLHVTFYKNYTGKMTLRVVSMNGRVIKTFNYSEPAGSVSKVLNMEGVTPGIYLIQLCEENKISDVKKIIVY